MASRIREFSGRSAGRGAPTGSQPSPVGRAQRSRVTFPIRIEVVEPTEPTCEAKAPFGMAHAGSGFSTVAQRGAGEPPKSGLGGFGEQYTCQ